MTEHLVDRVVAKLDLSVRPEPTLEGRRRVYASWCRHVPFDNIRKLIHVRRQDTGPLPGDSEADFFDSWLRCGAGGTVLGG